MCVVYHPKAWRRMSIFYAFCSVAQFMTMVFFASDVCSSNGCTIQKAGGFAIASGFMWLFAAALTFKSGPMDRSKQKSSCCCCPAPIIQQTHQQSAYKAISLKEDAVDSAKESEEKALMDDEEEEPVEEAPVASGE